MSDVLAPVFEDRNTRLSSFSDEQRGQLELTAKNSGDPEFLDRQFSAMWLSRRTGLPHDEVVKNFDGLSRLYFGEGATPSKAYDSISGLYKKSGASSEDSAGGTPTTQADSPYSASGTVISKDIAGSLAMGASRTGYSALGGVSSTLSALTGVKLALASEDKEYAELNSELLGIDSDAVDIVRQAYGKTPRSANPEQRRGDIRKRMSEIEASMKAANDAVIEAFKTIRPGQQEFADAMRKTSDTMFELAQAEPEEFGVRQEFSDSTVGQLTRTAGSLPVTALFAYLGPVVGGAATFGSIEGEVEMERKAIEGDAYDPQRAFLANAVSAGPQAVLEFAFGMERVMGQVLKATPKIGGRVAFGDALKVMGKRGLASGIEEGITEPTQSFWNDYVASLSYDEKRELLTPEAFKQRAIEGLTAFAFGSLFGGGVSGIDLVDRNRGVAKAEQHLTTRNGQPFTPYDWAALRTAKTDEEIKGMAPDPGMSDVYLAAANGNPEAQAAYFKDVQERAFVETDGLSAHGMTIGKSGEAVAIRNADGSVITLDPANKEHSDFLLQLQADAVQAKNELEQREGATSETIKEFEKRFGDQVQIERMQMQTLSELTKSGVITADQEADALAAAQEINKALTGEGEVQVQGIASLTTDERTGAIRMAAKIAEGVEPTVVVEEVAESWYKKALAEGQLDPAELTAQRQKWHAQEGEADPVADGKVTSQRADVEWFSKRVIDYALANRKTEIPGGWGKWLRALGERLKAILRGAARMKKLLRDGKIDPQLEQWMQQALGAKPEKSAATQVQQKGEPGGLMSTFNLGNVENKPVAPAKFRGIQEGMPKLGFPDIELWNLTEGIEGHGAGSTVSRQTIEKAGFYLPPAPSQDVSFSLEKVTRMSDALKQIGYIAKSSDIDRQGAHSPADPESGAPAWGLTENGIYPKDVYDYVGLKYYGTGEDRMDSEAYNILLRMAGAADRQIRIYRSVEKDSPARGIQPGDWVTIVKEYARDHGKAALGGNFRIQEKLVMAGDIFTAGDSWLEWGYHPQDHGLLLKARKIAKAEVNVSSSDITFAITGIPQNKTRAMQAKLAQFRAQQAATFPYPYHQLAALPTQARISGKGHEVSVLAQWALPMSERLRYISDKLGINAPVLSRVRRYYFEKGELLKKYSDMVTPLMRGLTRLNATDLREWSVAASNQDALNRDRLTAKYNLQNEWAQYTAARDQLRAEMLAAGIDVGLIEEYFPRWVKDVVGLRQSLGMEASESPLEQAVIDAEKSAGRTLTAEEVNDVIDAAVRGIQFGGIGTSAPSNAKQRKIQTIGPAQWEFYADANHALSRWLEQSTERIARHRFFGKNTVALPNASILAPTKIDLNASIGAIIREQLEAGNISTTQQQEIQDILDGLFAYHGKTNAFIRGVMDLSYVATMGKLSSSMAQAVDLMVAVYETGPLDVALAVPQAMWRNAKNLPGIGNVKSWSEAVGKFTKGKDWLTREQLGVDRIMDEFRDQRFTSRALNQVFTAVGLNFMDGIGKDTLVNVKHRQLVRQAKRGQLSRKNQQLLVSIFGEQAAAGVIADFAAGKKTDDTLFAVYNVLADWQPISLAEYPEAYAKNPRMRFLYMLKSYSIKMLGAYRREGFMQMWYGDKKQKIQGARNLSYLLALLLAAGVTKDWLVDFMLDRDPQLDDITVDNLFKLGQVSRYAVWQQRNRNTAEGTYGFIQGAGKIGQNLKQIIVDTIAPPFTLLERPAKDVSAWAKAKETGDAYDVLSSESIQFVPGAGEFLYWSGERGRAKIERRRQLRERDRNPRRRRDRD